MSTGELTVDEETYDAQHGVQPDKGGQRMWQRINECALDCCFVDLGEGRQAKHLFRRERPTSVCTRPPIMPELSATADHRQLGWWRRVKPRPLGGTLTTP